MRAADIEALVSVGRPTLAPDGSFAVFATSRPDLEANRNVGQLWRVELPAGEPRRLTRGIADRQPRLSPRGTEIAFLRADDEGKAQVHVVAAVGGEPVQVTAAPGGVTEFAWAPDGASLGFLARVPEAGRYGTVAGLDAASESPRRITGIRWHANGVGYVTDRPAQLFVVRAPDLFAEPIYESAPRVGAARTDSPIALAAEPVRLTSSAHHHFGLAFSADGRELLTIVEEFERDKRDLRTPVIAVAVDGGAVREIVPREAGLAVSELAVAPDGTVAILGADCGATAVDFIAPPVALYLVRDSGLERLTDPEVTDLGEVGSHVSFEGQAILVQNRVRGRVELVRVSGSGAMETLFGGDVEVVGHAAASDRIVVAHATPSSLGELAVIDTAQSPVVLTSFAAPLAGRGVSAPREYEITARDGYPVHGWVATPEGEGPFPVILQIHGGPYAAYGIHLFDETQVLVDAGYAVVYCNPRGSAGYGRAHGRSIRGRMGTLDNDDVLDFFDGVLQQNPELDGDRVGIMGGSYGGYLTAWIIAHEHRFAGAIVERGFLDPVSFQGTSDIGSFFGDEYVGTEPEAMARQSPLAVVGGVTTPTLVMHSELDFRCPLEQATRYYTALKRQGTDAEMLIFPGEDHELTRSGRPRHRVERFEAVLDWWQRYLPTS